MPGDGSDAIGEAAPRRRAAASRAGLRVLIVNTFEPRTPGGDMGQIKKTREHLEALGVEVDVSCTPRPDPRGYDVIHAFNLWFPQQTLPQLKGIRVAAPDVPIALTPIYWDMTEKAWADVAVPALFAAARKDGDLSSKLAALADGSYVSNGRKRSERAEPNFSGYERYQRAILRLVDHLLPQSEREARRITEVLGAKLPSTIVRNAAEPEVFERATPEEFTRRYGVRDFVVTVGLVEARKNQLLLLHALKETGLPVVVIGRNYDRNYYRLCREHAGRNALFIDHLPHEQLASALKAARVFALPSWMECASFACVEAALAGCSLVVSDRTSEPEYFEHAATYCDPASVDSIRNAVVAAHRSYPADEAKRAWLRQRFTTDFTWPKAAERTLAVYRELVANRPPGGARTPPSREREAVLAR